MSTSVAVVVTSGRTAGLEANSVALCAFADDMKMGCRQSAGAGAGTAAHTVIMVPKTSVLYEITMNTSLCKRTSNKVAFMIANRASNESSQCCQ